MIVDLVNVQTRDGIRLDGTWRKPHPENGSQLGVDVMIFHHGVGGNFYGAGMFDQYSEVLLAKGYAVLRVNNRGHDPISRAVVGERLKRLGAAYEDMGDCRHDWEAWMDFAQAAGYQRIGLWGHSLGATKSIYYMATQRDLRRHSRRRSCLYPPARLCVGRGKSVVGKGLIWHDRRSAARAVRSPRQAEHL